MSPPGAKITMIARIAPKTSRQYGTTDITVSCRKMNTKAPSTGPKKLAKPPSSAMNTRLPEWVQ